MGGRAAASFRRAQNISNQTNNIVQAFAICNIVALFSSGATNCRRSAGIEKEHKNKMKQILVYFVWEVLSEAKLNYSKLEKMHT